MEKKEKQKAGLFVAILSLIALIIVFAFIFWEPQAEIIQGEADATEVRISSKVPGRIEKFLVDEGYKVRKGDTLVFLDSPEIEAKIAQARAARAAATAIRTKVDEGTRVEELAMAFQTWQKAVAALNIAQKSYDRIKNLYENDVATAQKMDEAEANYKASIATEEAAKSQYEMAVNGARKEDRDAVAAQVAQAQGAVSEIESYLDEIVLVAPIDGEISERYPKHGELVGTGAPIMDIMDLTDMWVSFNVREDQFGELKMDHIFTAKVPALNNKEIELKVTYIRDRGSYAAWRATKTTGQFDAKTFEVKARPTQPVEGLRPGMSVLYTKGKSKK